jgi:hypothetical protein
MRRRMRPGLFIVVAVLGSACQARPPAPPAPRLFIPPPPVTEFLVREARLHNGAVTVRLEIPLASRGPKPAVIALIGDTHELIGSGFVAVSYTIDWAALKGPPPPPPQNTVGTWVLASPSAAVLGERYLREIAETATVYVPLIIDWLVTVPDVDPARIGMAGGSTNGFITLQAIAADRRIRAAVAVAACADYRVFLRDSSMGMRGEPLALDAAYERWIRSQEIIQSPRQVVHAALLMINRTGDELIPIGCADETAKVLSRAYARAGVPERFRYLRQEAAGHDLGPTERQEVLVWFQEWLGSQ